MNNQLLHTLNNTCINFNPLKLYNENNNIIYDGTLRLDCRQKFITLPFKINIIYGSLLCSNNKLADFTNFPDIVYGNLDVSNSDINSLLTLNTIVYGKLNLSHSNICYIGNNITYNKIKRPVEILQNEKYDFILGEFQW